MLHTNAGAEYGVTAGLGYHHLIPIKKFPLMIGGEFSISAGNELADDFKLRLGAQIRIAAFNHFQFSARVQGISRRFQNQSVTLFILEVIAQAHWVIIVNIGFCSFDKALFQTLSIANGTEKIFTPMFRTAGMSRQPVAIFIMVCRAATL